MKLLIICPFFALTLIAIGCQPRTPRESMAAALRQGNPEKVDELLEQGVEVTGVFNDKQQTALHLVAGSFRTEPALAQTLIDNGVDVASKDSSGQTAWEYLFGRNRSTVSDKECRFLLVLYQNGYRPGPYDSTELEESYLHYLAQNCQNADFVKQIADDNPDLLEAEDVNGWTPLHYAAYHGRYEAADGLLQAGANPNAKTKVELRKSYLKGETSITSDLQQAGSHPLDLYHRGFTKGQKDFGELMEKYEGTKNPEVKNRFYSH